MKNILLLALMSTFAMSNFNASSTVQGFNAQEQDLRLCKVFIKKAHKYQETMGNSEFAQATLESYKERVVSYCSTEVASAKIRSILATGDNKVLCKTSIRDAHAYQASMGNSEADKAALNTYKEKVVAHCGKLVAKS
jgi:hypothetical protein